MQQYTRMPLTDDTGLRPEKCPNCGALPDRLGILDQYENKDVVVQPPGVMFDHARRELRCLDCGHEWKLDRVKHFKPGAHVARARVQDWLARAAMR